MFDGYSKCLDGFLETEEEDEEEVEGECVLSFDSVF
jgi:hypothetical protein